MDLASTLSFLCPGARWSLDGNDYAALRWMDEQTPRPAMAELQQAWIELQSIKGWPNVQAFTDVFTMQEMAAVSLSSDPTIAALRFKLSTWFGRVEVQDQRIQLGLNRMVELNLITAERKAAIEALAS